MIEDWMPALTSRLGTLEGLDGGVRTYADLPAALMEFPIMVLTTRRGRVEWGASIGSIGLHQLQATIYLPGPFLPESHTRLVPFIGQVLRKLAGAVTLGGLVSHVGPTSEGDFYSGPGEVTYGSADETAQKFAGIHFFLEVKEHDTSVVVSA